MTTTGPEKHLDVHVVAHTHWDREWYRTAVEFQQRLVALVDELLDGESAPPFLLDGQGVVLEDYLALRPERASDVSARLRSGRLEAGPWYVLADELIPGGESLIRNLLAGRRMLRQLRATPPPVLYCPDSFGHPAALPTLAAGFGLPLIVAWRGYGGRRWPAGDTVRWEAPDGSSAVLYHLPPDGYEFGSHLPVHEDGARERWRRVHDVLAPRATLGVVLLPNGADHHALQPRHGEAIQALAREASPSRVHASSLSAFAAALLSRCATHPLPSVSGELRDSYGYTWTLQGTFAARAAQKRHHAHVERLLVRDAEPWTALCWLRTRESRRHLVQGAWRSLLLCQPHDTLCGCSIDEVARAMDQRLEEGQAAAASLRDAAIARLGGHDPVAARERASEWSPRAVVRNRAARARRGVAEVEMDLPLAEVPVGPGSAGPRIVGRPRRAASLGAPVRGEQHLAAAPRVVLEESPRHYPRARLVERRRVLGWIDEVPAYGALLVPLVGRGARRPAIPYSEVTARGGEIASPHLVVRADGARVALQAEDATVENWLSVEAEGERGDLYTHSAIPGTYASGTLRRTRILERGPLRAELEAAWEVRMPRREVSTAAGGRERRPATRVRLETVVQLDAGTRFARVLVRGVNTAPNVRLRLRLHTGLANGQVVADAMFGPVVRTPLSVPPEDTHAEAPPLTAPLHRYVSLYAEGRGATVYNDGLTEYEASADGSVAITLLRATGDLSRSDLPERPGHAGYPAATPLAQSLGPFEAVLGFLFHGPRTPETIAEVERTADDVLLPLVGTTWRTALDPPPSLSGIELAGEGLAFQAAKESEDGEWIALRCANLLDTPVAGTWRIAGVHEARLARLDETPLEALPVADGAVPFVAAPRAVVTVLAR